MQQAEKLGKMQSWLGDVLSQDVEACPSWLDRWTSRGRRLALGGHWLSSGE